MASHSDLRQLKFWGWGYEDQQPPVDEVSATVAAAREHLGFEPSAIEQPARLEDIELPRPRTVEMTFEPGFIELVQDMKRTVETGGHALLEVE